MIAETICEQQDTISQQQATIGQQQETINKLREIISQLRETIGGQQETISQQQDTISQQQDIINQQQETISQLQENVIDNDSDDGEEDSEEEEDEISPVVDNEDDAEWIPLKGYEKKYEIWNCYPYPIKKIKSGKIIKESINQTSGYVQISLNGKSQQKHKIIAKQFIPNNDPKNKIFVDHIDHERTNYNVRNLRWVTPRENMLNRSSTRGIKYEYVDKISDEATVIEEYGKHHFENYYYHDNVFYFYNGTDYRKLHINENKGKNKFVNLNDTDKNRVQVVLSKFKEIYNLD